MEQVSEIMDQLDLVFLLHLPPMLCIFVAGVSHPEVRGMPQVTEVMLHGCTDSAGMHRVCRILQPLVTCGDVWMGSEEPAKALHLHSLSSRFATA